jgi:hypothetical protein
VSPWRFDRARNEALELVPASADVCIAIDLDEVLVEGWRETIERSWVEQTTRLRYLYAWTDEHTFWYDAVHARRGYAWRHPTHEVLVENGGREQVWAVHSGVLVEHHPDRAKERPDDLALLELGATEAPDDPRALHYLARECFFRGLWRRCIATVERYLALPAAGWDEERSYSCRISAASAEQLGEPAAAMDWRARACAECPRAREPWCDLAEAALRAQAHAIAYASARQALRIRERSWSHLNDPAAWGVRPQLMAAAAARALGLDGEADAYAVAAEAAADSSGADGADWQALSEVAAWSLRTGRLARGAEAADRFAAAPDIPDHTRERARRASVATARRLVDLVAGTTVTAIPIDVDDGWSAFNPSIALDGDGYRMIVRSSNYTLSERGYDLGGDDRVRTRNYDVRLDADLAIRAVARIDDRTGKPPWPGATTGYEDCRLFCAGGSWYASATTREHDRDARCAIALLELRGSSFEGLTVLDDPAGGHAKNWMPVAGSDGSFVSSCAPTIVLRRDGRTGTLNEIARRPGPPVARAFRGGSQVIPVDDGRLAVVHEAIDMSRRRRCYTHRFVRLDDGFAVTHVSPPFVFLHRGVEFCAGLAVRDGLAILSFGFQDAEAYLASAPLAAILDSLRAVPTR